MGAVKDETARDSWHGDTEVSSFTNMLLLVISQDEATTVITLLKQDSTAQVPSRISLLNMKPPENLTSSIDYDPLYIFVSDTW